MTIRNNSLNRENVPNFWIAITQFLRRHTDSKISAKFEWGVIAFAAGISLYFAASFEPNLIVLLALILVLLFLFLGLPRRFYYLRIILLGICLIVMGVGRSVWHSQAVESPRLPPYETAYWITGWVSDIQKSGPRTRWEIKVSHIDNMADHKTPHIIRTSSGGSGVNAGDFIRIRSVLSAPRGPAVPGGYDPARRVFFEGIGGSGYAISKAETLDDLPLSFLENMQRHIVQIRHRIAGRVLAVAPEETAGLQVGLLTGIRTYIPEHQTTVLRTAGLAHILAISGLHMGLMAGSVYFLASLGLACIGPLARRYDIRKPAAIIGALAATTYLIISGASVATQRAFIMTIIVFLAVIMDRRAFSMRSVALAAAITLLWHPEAIVGAGFQMSFAAVGALIAVYQVWDKHREHLPRGFFGRMSQSLKSLSITSFVAGTATSGFAMLHFNRIASYGLAGNLLAMPVFTFLVMPAGLAVFPAMIIGQESFPLSVMGYGLSLMLSLSGWVAQWHGSVAFVAAGPTWVIGVFGLGFAGLCLGPYLARVIGLLLMLICMLVWFSSPRPDMRISSDGAIAFWSEGDWETLYVNRKRADKYGREQFARRRGQGELRQKSYEKSYARCDPLGCRIKLKGYDISIIANPSEVSEECLTADLVILTNRMAGPVARRHCNSILIDMRALRRGGSQNVFLEKAKIRLNVANPQKRAARPWGM